MNTVTNPIVIFGGLLSLPMAYQEMREVLHQLTGKKVSIVNALLVDWLRIASMGGWVNLLDKLDITIQEAMTASSTGKITLIGHSAGGLLSRLYLGNKPIRGRVYNGVKRVDHLITLGSPHIYRGRLGQGGRLSRWVEEQYPGAYFTPQVRYTSVAGKSWRGSLLTTRRARLLYSIYENISGDETAWGDGLVPVKSALLPGSEQMVLEEVNHFSMIMSPWYGSPEVIEKWWSANKMRYIYSSRFTGIASPYSS